MKKVDFGNLSRKNVTKLYEGNETVIYRTRDGQILKTFSQEYLTFLKMQGSDLEKRILNAGPIFSVPEIVTPNAVAYSNGTFLGYTTNEINGYNLLILLVHFHTKIEKI